MKSSDLDVYHTLLRRRDDIAFSLNAAERIRQGTLDGLIEFHVDGKSCGFTLDSNGDPGYLSTRDKIIDALVYLLQAARDENDAFIKETMSRMTQIELSRANVWNKTISALQKKTRPNRLKRALDAIRDWLVGRE